MSKLVRTHTSDYTVLEAATPKDLATKVNTHLRDTEKAWVALGPVVPVIPHDRFSSPTRYLQTLVVNHTFVNPVEAPNGGKSRAANQLSSLPATRTWRTPTSRNSRRRWALTYTLNPRPHHRLAALCFFSGWPEVLKTLYKFEPKDAVLIALRNPPDENGNWPKSAADLAKKKLEELEAEGEWTTV